MPRLSRRASVVLHVVLIVAAAVLVGIGTLGNAYVFDDHMLLAGSAPLIFGEAPLSSAFTYRYWGAADEAAPNELYRPVTIASLALNARVLGGEPAGMHAVNLALHAINAVLAYFLIRMLFHRPVVALLAACLFAVHPAVTEAVAPVAGRADLLAGLFLLLGACLSPLACRGKGPWSVACCLAMALLAFLGALSKETVFVAPLVTAAVLGADRLRHRGTPQERRHYLATAIILGSSQIFALAMALILRVRILGYVYRFNLDASPSASYLAFVNNPLQFAEPLGRVLTALRVAVMAAGKLLLPLGLSADYSFDQIPVSTGWPGPAELLALSFALIYLGLLFWSSRRFPVAFFALSWSALTYLIVSNLLFPIGTIFGERLLYLPSIGFALLLATGIARIAAGGRIARTAGVALAIILILSYGTLFVARARDWSDDERLFRTAVEASPRSAKAHSNYGFVLQRAGRVEESIAAYGRALEIAPKMTGSRMSLGRLLAATGRPNEAIAQFTQVIEVDPSI
ncbi:MAG TPA: tetratricopeptide repeat protein, partial [Candidatus Polarisedimenticolia bacterium]|nr:tetratricopeptide repeat protein [Candidatus Polarisedimenticolia bacterium]